MRGGQTLRKTLALARAFRETDADTPIVLMGYYNPIYVYGVEAFLRDADAAGVDGLIVVDLPPEEDEELCLPALKAGLNFIRLATPTTDDKRLPAVLANTSGFVYYVSITGVTGAAAADPAKTGAAVARIKRHTHLPVAVGFGVKDAASAAAIAGVADGVVVGSALVEALARFAGRRQGGAEDGRRRRRAWRGRSPPACAAPPRRMSRRGLADELDLQRRPAENPLAAAPGNAGESVGQMPGERPARLSQGPRGQPDGGAGLRLPHGDRAAGRGWRRCSTTAPTKSWRFPRRCRIR